MTELLLLMIPVAGLATFLALIAVPIIKGWFGITKRVKPFDCENCMGWWLGLLVFAFRLIPVQSITPIEIIAGSLYTIALAACTSLLAVFIAKHIKP